MENCHQVQYNPKEGGIIYIEPLKKLIKVDKLESEESLSKKGVLLNLQKAGGDNCQPTTPPLPGPHELDRSALLTLENITRPLIP